MRRARWTVRSFGCLIAFLCTSKSAESDKVWGLRQGARDYVVKPVDIPDLLTKIAKLA